MKTISHKRGERYLETLTRCGGYYECPKDRQGNRLGPLVAYAGRDESGRQYVGDVYVNFAKAERHIPVLVNFAEDLTDLVSLISDSEQEIVFCGAPEGGKALAVALAEFYGDSQYIYPEKKIVELKTATSRERAELVFDRHIPGEDDFIWIVEDVCNNFSTTEELIRLIEKHGAKVGGIVCFLNRSDKFTDEFLRDNGDFIPVVSLVQKVIPQFSQEDPFVAKDVIANNVVWKPKNDWDRLSEAMKRV